jgi:hypothetical protein
VAETANGWGDWSTPSTTTTATVTAEAQWGDWQHSKPTTTTTSTPVWIPEHPHGRPKKPTTTTTTTPAPTPTHKKPWGDWWGKHPESTSSSTTTTSTPPPTPTPTPTAFWKGEWRNWFKNHRGQGEKGWKEWWEKHGQGEKAPEWKDLVKEWQKEEAHNKEEAGEWKGWAGRGARPGRLVR